MRILGFSKLWKKLTKDRFTTFRFPRRDKDWQEGEKVQIVYKPRSKDRLILGIATIKKMEMRWVIDRRFPGIYAGQYPPKEPDCSIITDKEAQADGFKDHAEMSQWIAGAEAPGRNYEEPMNKIILAWNQKFMYSTLSEIDYRWAELHL